MFKVRGNEAKLQIFISIKKNNQKLLGVSQYKNSHVKINACYI